MPDLALVPKSELDRVRGAAGAEPDARLALLADMCRLNTLVAIKCAGSGHLGSSFSALDIMAHLLYEELNVGELGFDHPERDVFFSSKGHDVPGLYAALYGLGVCRRSNCSVSASLAASTVIPTSVSRNRGELGVARDGHLQGPWYRLGEVEPRLRRPRGGDDRRRRAPGGAELGGAPGCGARAARDAVGGRRSQRAPVGQANRGDRRPGRSRGKLEAFGWDVRTCDGHDHAALREAFAALRQIEDRPNALIAQTVKGKGVSFMERSAALAEGGGYYMWHAGAPDDDDFERARDELVERIGDRLEELGLGSLELASVARAQKHVSYSLEGEPESGAGAPLHKVTEEYVVEAYGEALVELGASNDRIVVLDADLASDCRVRGFELAFPIASSSAGSRSRTWSRPRRVSPATASSRGELIRVIPRIARQRADLQPGERGVEGRLRAPLRGAHSRGPGEVAPERARHLASRRASEHDDRPAGYFRRDARASPLGARGRGGERRRPARDWALPRQIELASGYEPTVGRGSRLQEGDDAVLLAYGPVLLHEALLGSERLAEQGIRLAVVNMPWLNYADLDWLTAEIAPYEHILVLDDHSPVGGLGDTVRRALDDRPVTVYGVEGWPACGTPEEALGFHQLDGASLARRIAARLGVRA